MKKKFLVLMLFAACAAQMPTQAQFFKQLSREILRELDDSENSSQNNNRHKYMVDRNKDGSVMDIRVKEPGQLARRLAEYEKETVTLLTIDGPLNEADIRVIADIAKRKEIKTRDGKTRSAWLDLDLEYARLQTGNTSMAGMFSGCSTLRTMIMPNNMTAVGDNAFSGCRNLENILLPYDTESIGKSAFYDCGHLQSIDLPEGVVRIGAGAFQDCSSITEIHLPEGLEIIGDNAFRGTGLRQISLPASLRALGGMAFRNTRIEVAEIPASVSECAFTAFDNNYLREYRVEPGNPALSSVEGVLFSADGTTLFRYPVAKEGDYVVPATVTRIDAGAFNGRGGLRSIVLNDNIVDLPDDSFLNCRSLMRVTLPKSLRSIGTRAFEHCAMLIEVNFPETLEVIGEHCFQGCKVLREVVIPASVRVIGNKAFYDCDKVVSFTIHCTTPPVASKVNDNLKKTTLRVPAASYDEYTKSDGWNKFKNIEKF